MKCEVEFKKVLAKLHGAQRNSRHIDYQVAVLLHRIKSRRLYAGAYSGWEAFIAAELSMGRVQAYAMVALIENGVPEEAFKRVGWSKLHRMAPIKARHAIEYSKLLAVAHAMPRPELVARIAEIAGKCSAKTPSITIEGPAAAIILQQAAARGMSAEQYILMKVNRQSTRESREKRSAAA